MRRRFFIRRRAWGRWHWAGTILFLILVCSGIYLCRFTSLLR